MLTFAIVYFAIALLIFLIILGQEFQGQPLFCTSLDNRWIDSAIFALLWLPFVLLWGIAILMWDEIDDD